MNHLTIGHAAKLSGVGVETIRFYERQGLIEQPPKPGSGFRRYSPETVRKIRFIRRAKEIGFSLREIRELLGFYFDTQTSCEDVRERARIKIADMEARITDLEKMKSALQALVDECGSRDGVCPILETLAETHEGGDIILLNFFRTQIKADSRRLTLSSHCSAFLVSSAFIRSYLRSIQGFGRTAAIRQRKLNCREETHEPARLLLF